MVSNSLDVAAAQQAQNEALTRQLGLTDATADLFCVPGLTNSWALCFQQQQQEQQQQQQSVSSVLAPIDNNHAVGSKRSATDASAAPAFQAFGAVADALAPAAKRPCLDMAAAAAAPEQTDAAAEEEAVLPSHDDVPAASQPQQSPANLRRSKWQPELRPSKSILKRMSDPALPVQLQSSASSSKLAPTWSDDIQPYTLFGDTDMLDADACPAALNARDSLTLAASNFPGLSGIEMLPSVEQTAAAAAEMEQLQQGSEEQQRGSESPRSPSDMSSDTQVDMATDAAKQQHKVIFARTIKVRYIPNVVQQRRRRLAAQRAATAAAAAAEAAAAAAAVQHSDPLACNEQHADDDASDDDDDDDDDDEGCSYSWPMACRQASYSQGLVAPMHGGVASEAGSDAAHMPADHMMLGWAAMAAGHGQQAPAEQQEVCASGMPSSSALHIYHNNDQDASHHHGGFGCAFDGASVFPPKLRVKIPRRYAEAWARQQQQHAGCDSPASAAKHAEQLHGDNNSNNAADEVQVAAATTAAASSTPAATLLVTISVE